MRDGTGMEGASRECAALTLPCYDASGLARALQQLRPRGRGASWWC